LFLTGGLHLIASVICILPVCLVKPEGSSPKFTPNVNQEIELTKNTDRLLTDYTESEIKV